MRVPPVEPPQDLVQRKTLPRIGTATIETSIEERDVGPAVGQASRDMFSCPSVGRSAVNTVESSVDGQTSAGLVGAPSQSGNYSAPVDQVKYHSASVKGSIKKCIRYWQDIGADDFILGTIDQGYKIPFYSEPEPMEFPKHASAFRHKTFVSNEIKALLSKGCVEKCEKPEVINPLSVSVNSCGKERLILDLRHVNANLLKFPVRYENLYDFSKFIQKDGFLIKFDLKSGYHHLDIFEGHQNFLGFSWDFGSGPEYFVFTVLPFGLSSACSIFNKLLKPFLSKWRANGIKTIL